MVGDLAEGGGAEAAQPERDAEEHAGDQPDPTGQQILRIDQDGGEGRGHDDRHGDGQHAGPEQVGVGQHQREGQGAQDGEPHDRDAADLVTDQTAQDRADHDADQEGEQE